MGFAFMIWLAGEIMVFWGMAPWVQGIWIGICVGIAQRAEGEKPKPIPKVQRDKRDELYERLLQVRHEIAVSDKETIRLGNLVSSGLPQEEHERAWEERKRNQDRRIILFKEKKYLEDEIKKINEGRYER